MRDFLSDYLDGIDADVVAQAAINLDWQAFLNHQISRESYEETLAKSPEQIMQERDRYRIQENLNRR